jgi:hypothetical protein
MQRTCLGAAAKRNRQITDGSSTSFSVAVAIAEIEESDVAAQN